MPIGDVLPEIAMLVAAIVALLAASFMPWRHQWLGAPLALAGLLAAGVLCAAQLAMPPRLTFSGTWALDGAGIWARLLIVVATALAVLLSPDWFKDDRRHGEYYVVLLLSALGAMLLAAAADTLQLVMGVLLSSVTGYVLAAYHRDWALSVEAGMKYFLIGALANTLLMIGVALLFGLLGDTTYDGMAAALGRTAPSPALLLAVTLVVVGIAFKLGAVPAHAWLPDVAEGAPAPAAAFLTVVPKIGAALALARLLQLFPPEAAGWHPLVATLAAATMTMGNLAALGQTDVRRMIGWSSVSQSGYALMAVAVLGLSTEALPALLFFLAGYAAANLAAFAVVAHLRGRTDIEHYRGLAASRPWPAAVLVLSFLSLVGIPPLAGFVGKLTLFLATIDGGYAWLAVVAIANTVISRFYYLKVLAAMYFGDPAKPAGVLGSWTATALGLTGAGVVALGLGAEKLLLALNGASLLP
ncbi:MAG: NADH-quinone oxidoreductase subunit N [Pseudomonadota bacterium]|nr:NADH-quinone oxidoreductase subunit N [Pseudomonadota bacterium]